MKLLMCLINFKLTWNVQGMDLQHHREGPYNKAYSVHVVYWLIAVSFCNYFLVVYQLISDVLRV